MALGPNPKVGIWARVVHHVSGKWIQVDRMGRAAKKTFNGIPPTQDRALFLHTKGWLPYTLRWQFRVTESRYPYGFTLDAWGDFVGCGVWTLRQDGPWVDVIYDWEIRADKPLLRYGSAVLKPIFAANHRWAMARGEESLRLELPRHRAATVRERAAISAPPSATTSAFPASIAVAVLVVGGLSYGVTRRRKGRPMTWRYPLYWPIRLSARR